MIKIKIRNRNLHFEMFNNQKCFNFNINSAAGHPSFNSLAHPTKQKITAFSLISILFSKTTTLI